VARAELDAARRQSKGQAAPLRRGAAQVPAKNARAPTRCRSRPPRPPVASKPRGGRSTPQGPLPDACPGCGGHVRETEVCQQDQTEIPRRPLLRPFNVHVGCGCGCGRRVPGRHPLPTSDARGAAAAQLGPDGWDGRMVHDGFAS
jgi:transposase